MVCCYQGTKVFCAWYQVTGTFSARGPCYSGPFAERVNTLCFQDSTFDRYSAPYCRLQSGVEASQSTKYSVNSSNHFGRSCIGSPRVKLSSSFDSKVCSVPPGANLRSCFDLFAGLCVDSSRFESCDEDVVAGGAALDLGRSARKTDMGT